MIKELIELAELQIGVEEQPRGSNNVLYNTVYYGGAVSGSAFPWCCAFIWWLFAQLGLSNVFCGGAKTAYCPYVVDYAKQHNQWVTTGYRKGDIVLFDWDGDKIADHIGLVVDVLGSALTTIEGNVNEAVCRLTRNEVGVMGAYRPNYDEAQPEPQPAPSSDTYTVVKGDTLWGIAEKTLGAGERYIQIMTANNLTSDMIYPGQVLVIPGGDTHYHTIQITINNDTYELLSIMAEGWNKSIGQVIDALMEDAV